MRIFELALPQPTAAPSEATAARQRLRFGAPEHLYIPRMLERDGLAGYEAETLACFLSAAQLRGGPVFDVGANIGVFALLAAALTDADAVAFEPTPELAQVAREVAGDNGLSFDVEEIALGAENGTADFYLSSYTDASNSLLEGFRPSDQSITVTVETVDDYCARTGRVPAVLKVDTEATEPDVLRGALNVITEHRPWILCEVLARRTEAQLEELFTPLGYSWYQITTELPLARRREIFGDRSYRFKNWLFAPEPPGDELWDAMRVWQRALNACTPLPKPRPKPRAAPVPHPPRAGGEAADGTGAHGGAGANRDATEGGAGADASETATPAPAAGSDAEPQNTPAAGATSAPPAAKPTPKPGPTARKKKRRGVYGRKKMLASFLTGACCGIVATNRRRNR